MTDNTGSGNPDVSDQESSDGVGFNLSAAKGILMAMDRMSDGADADYEDCDNLHALLMKAYPRVINEKHIKRHEEYMQKMIPRDNELNIILQIWEQFARDTKFYGPGDNATMTEEESIHESKLRSISIQNAGYAIPCEDALDNLAKHGPILEVGSGSGYWTMLLRARGVDVIAVDNQEEKFGKMWISDTVIADGVDYLHEHGGCGGRALFLCWPRDGLAFLEAYAGDTVFVVGEGLASATWFLDTSQPEMKEWTLIENVEIPVWSGLHDCMWIYKRIHH